MLNLIRVVASVVLVTACSSTALAGAKSSAASEAVRVHQAQVVSARAELAQDEMFRTSDASLLETAQAALDASIALSSAARDKAGALKATATALRGIAYELTNRPGLSAAQNHKMVAAMEAADAAESAAGAAQTTANLAAGVVRQNNGFALRLTAAIESLDQRMEACNAFIHSSDLASRAPGHPPLERESLALGTTR